MLRPHGTGPTTGSQLAQSLCITAGKAMCTSSLIAVEVGRCICPQSHLKAKIENLKESYQLGSRAISGFGFDDLRQSIALRWREVEFHRRTCDIPSHVLT